MCKKFSFFNFLFIFILFTAPLIQAQDSTHTNNQSKDKTHGQHFIDEDGDGYNDNAPDHDGDGIPNGLDPDWQKLKAEKQKQHRRQFVDLDGDGINDNLQNDTESDVMEIQNMGEQKNGSSLEGQAKQGEAKGKKKQGMKR